MTLNGNAAVEMVSATTKKHKIDYFIYCTEQEELNKKFTQENKKIMNTKLESDIMECVNKVLNKVEEIADNNDKPKEEVLHLLMNELNSIYTIGW